MRSCGVEVEKPISNTITGLPHGVSQDFFRRINDAERGSSLYFSDIQPDCIIALDVPEIGHVGLDNGFNLQETSSKVTNSLELLDQLINVDMQLVQASLLQEGASVINFSAHPLGSTSEEAYNAFVAPKGVYSYILKRGWNHRVGIDAKAHNSPHTGVEAWEAASALTTIIGAGAAFISIFSNSPFLEGEVTGYKESRALLWDEFMRNSISEGDRTTAKFPNQPFNTLKEYFEWMMGEGTNIHFVMTQSADYKTFGDAAVLIEGNPSTLDFLRQTQARGQFFNSGKKITVEPKLNHLEAMQFAQFSGARIRWGFVDNAIDKQEFLAALDSNTLESLFSTSVVKDLRIEGRDSGANFADSEIEEMGGDIARSVAISPSALQHGLINNLEESHAFIRSFPWKMLGALRQEAIKYGLDGEVGGVGVDKFADKILQLAARGLESSSHWMLAYPQAVLGEKASGADRALRDYNNGCSLEKIVKSRHVR